MDEKSKLILGLIQVESLSKLLSENEYQEFFYKHLVEIQVELKRQLSHYE